MPIHISWESQINGTPIQLSVPVLDAELRLSWVGEVITDAAWVISHNCQVLWPLSAQALQIQRYLLNPVDVDLHVVLHAQGGVYGNKVWNALLGIPVGQVMSYSALAEKLGSGPRAVAGACRDNPFAGLIPCHRVVAKSGIGGFMGQRSGEFVAFKQQLLDYERSIARNQA